MKGSRSILIALATGTGAGFIPLVGHLHFESAFLACWVGSLVAVWYVNRNDGSGADNGYGLLTVLFWIYLAAVPLLIKDLATGCFSVDGLGFWLFLPAPSIFLAFSLTRLCHRLKIPFPRFWSICIIMAVAAGEFLFEFYTFPQVFFYNHIWGYWPGPIYDETLSIDASLLYFRGLTGCWGILFWFFPDYSTSASARRLFWLAAAGLLFGYFNLSEMGIVRPTSAIRQSLDDKNSTTHIDIYYSRDHIPQRARAYYSKRHEFFYRQIVDTLKLQRRDGRNRIESFVYTHPWQKKRIVGAKYTSYVPVWLEQDQLHSAYPRLSSSLHHELVHVAAKSFGNRLLNASWSIGLVEGLAVALARNPSSFSTVDQLVAARKPYPSVRQLSRTLSFFGFYGGRQNVNYTTMGSFIGYLLQNYEVERFKKAYPSAAIASHYPVPFDSLVSGWHRHLDTVDTDSIDQARRTSLFSIPSLFEQKCPHTQSAADRQWDRYQFLMAERDTARAQKYLGQACTPSCSDPRLWTEWAKNRIEQKHPARVIKDTVGLHFAVKEYPPAAVRIADALFMQGERHQANKQLRRASFSDNPLGILQQSRIRKLRTDSVSWTRTIRVLYGKGKKRGTDFKQLPGPLKAVMLDRMMEEDKWEKLVDYAGQVDSADIQTLDYQVFIKTARRLIFMKKESAATHLLNQLKASVTRQRHKQMMRMVENWKKFMF